MKLAASMAPPLVPHTPCCTWVAALRSQQTWAAQVGAPGTPRAQPHGYRLRVRQVQLYLNSRQCCRQLLRPGPPCQAPAALGAAGAAGAAYAQCS